MKYSFSILAAAALFAACSGGDDLPARKGAAVELSVAPLGGGGGTFSRAAVDEWDQTPVSLAYRMDSDDIYTQNVDVVVKGDVPQIIHMGIGYGDNAEDLYVRGYHPAAAPDAAGIVRYDISRGDADLMVSNEVSGNEDDTIIEKGVPLKFEHKLTRLTIRMACASGHTYTGRIAAVIVAGNNGTGYISTKAELDLEDGSVEFRGLGTVTAGYVSEGREIPPYESGAPVEIDAMVRPSTPLKISLLTIDDTIIDIDLSNSDELESLETNGGEEGKQYFINLTLHSPNDGGRKGAVHRVSAAVPDTPDGAGNRSW